MDNFKTVVDFEEYAVKENGKFDRKNIEKARKVIEKYQDIYYKKIKARERKLKFEISKQIDKLSKLSLFFPPTFYMNTTNEVSSRGYLNYLGFYGYGEEMKDKSKKWVYLPDTGEFPADITGMQLLCLFKRIGRLQQEAVEKIISLFDPQLLKKRFKHVDASDKAQILLVICSFMHPEVYILKDFSTGIPCEKWKELEARLNSVLGKNTILIDITTNDRYWLSTPDTQVFVIYKNGKYHARSRRIVLKISDQ